MKRLERLEKGLKKIGGNIILAKTPGYEYYFEEFLDNIWRLNIVLDSGEFSLDRTKKIRNLIGEIYPDYNLIFSVPRQMAIEYWEGKVSKSKSLLMNIVFISRTAVKEIWDASRIINRRVISGEDFVWDFVNRPYNWREFIGLMMWNFAFVNYNFFKENIPEIFRIGMLKSSFLQFISAVVYCKGRIPSNKEKIRNFFKEKLKDEKMVKIIDDFYENKYKNIDNAVEDTIYFSNKLNKWPGLN